MSPSLSITPAFPNRAAFAGRRSLRLLARRAAARTGFTLLEAAMATIIIGVGFVAVLGLLVAGTNANASSSEMTTAIHLAGNIHEAGMRMTYDDMFDLEGNYLPAVDGQLAPLEAMDGWSQSVDVRYVNHNLLTATVPDDQEEPTARVFVTVSRNGKAVYRTSWLVAASR